MSNLGSTSGNLYMLYIQTEAFDAAGAERLHLMLFARFLSYLVMQQLKNVHIHRNIYKGAGTQNFSFFEKMY